MIISAIGIRAHETFPRQPRRRAAVMGLAALLVAATMASAVLTG